MGTTSYHVALSIRGTLAQSRKEQARTARACRDEHGKPISLAAFQNGLMDLLSEGYELVPPVGCDNFDKKTGCRGHAGELLAKAPELAAELTPSEAEQARARQESCHTCKAAPGDYCLDKTGVRRRAHEPRLRAAGLPTGRAA